MTQTPELWATVRSTKQVFLIIQIPEGGYVGNCSAGRASAVFVCVCSCVFGVRSEQQAEEWTI